MSLLLNSLVAEGCAAYYTAKPCPYSHRSIERELWKRGFELAGQASIASRCIDIICDSVKQLEYEMTDGDVVELDILF
jgi:hypothetical protein